MWDVFYIWKLSFFTFNEDELNIKNVRRLRFELRTSRLKAGCSTAQLATHFVKLSTYEIIPF